MEKSTEIDLSDTKFIDWLISRLEYVHGYAQNNDIISRLKDIKDKLEKYNIKYSDKDLDKIISRYFIDFYLTRDNSSFIGYTETERNNLRNSIKHIIEDVKLNNLPKDILLK